MLLIHDPEQGRAVSQEALVARYDLTAAEARLAARLADGESLADAARANNIAEGTARQQLKMVFQKTDTRRQAELVARLLTDTR